MSAEDLSNPVSLSYVQTDVDTLYVDAKTHQLVDASRRVEVAATAHLASGRLPLANVRNTTTAPTAAARDELVGAADHLRSTADRARSWGSDYPAMLGIAAAILGVLTGIARVKRPRLVVLPMPDTDIGGDFTEKSPRQHLPVR